MRSRANSIDLQSAILCAVSAAHQAGAVMRRNLRSSKRVNATTKHDIKLELDVRCQKIIERRLQSEFSQIPVLGEEGSSKNQEGAYRWVVDPIDGTVNFAYGIPHACVSIALQQHHSFAGSAPTPFAGYRSLVGVVYDPFADELWTATAGRRARLNNRPIQVSTRRRLTESIITIGFAKYQDSLKSMLPVFSKLVHRVLKLRIMGSAALALTYVASGRFDGYVESGLRLWDIAAGSLILESAGGRCDCELLDGNHRYGLLASNSAVHRSLEPLAKR